MEEAKIIITINKDKIGNYKSSNCEIDNAHVYDLMLAACQLFKIIQKKDTDGTAFSSMFNLANTYSAEKNEDKDNHSDSDESK